MNTITIEIDGQELEKMSIELTSEEVRSLFNLRKENNNKIEELTKKLANVESSLKYANESKEALNAELNDAHILLSALSVEEKSKEADDWRRTSLKVATRIALYIAGNK